jgi:shikimate kinase
MKVFLIGMPGSGKTTIGNTLADMFGFKFHDLDRIIINKAGLEINEIFSEYGEERFREIERGLLTEKIESNEDFIMATGGGTPCYYNTMDLLKRKGTVVYLDVPIDELTNRLYQHPTDRPLLADKETISQDLSALLTNRDSIFKQADIVLKGSNIDAQQLYSILEDRIKN